MLSAYPHPSPELRRPTGESLRLWGDGEVRRQALVAVVDAWVAGTAELSRAINHVDAAVAEGLGVLGLPRGPVRQVRIDSMRPGLNGQKLRDCTIVLVGEYMRTFVQVRQQADPVFRTWIHESLHARHPYAPGASAEYRAFRGYEEGLVEGLTQVVLAAARIAVADVPFRSYVTAYRALAATADIELEALLRALWRYPAGEVRQNVPAVVAALHEAATRRVLAPETHVRLLGIGDRLFGTDRGSHTPHPAVLARLWRRAVT